MSDRAMPGVSGPPACPFVAFEDERDERSTSPDHRHRCYAEVRPAPRALAHQEAYCLSSAFPVCPTFQDWARREAAQARGSGRPVAAPPVGAEAVEPSLARGASDPDRAVDDGVFEHAAARQDDLDDGPDEPGGDRGADERRESAGTDDEPVIHRNPPRDWAAPPPWASGTAGVAGAGPAGAAGRAGASSDRAPGFLASREASQGLAGSAADRMASGLPAAGGPASPSPSPHAPASDELAELVSGGASGAGLPPIPRPPSGHYPTTSAAGRRPTVSSTRDRQAVDHDGPSWERARRYEAYPTIKVRASLPGIPTLAVLAGALVIAALALFFLPALLGVGGGGGASPSPTSSASASSSVAPSETPVASPSGQTYTIKKGDTLSKIAKKFGLTVDQLLAANKDTIKDPNKIGLGDVIDIPSPSSDTVTDSSEPSTSSSASP